MNLKARILKMNTNYESHCVNKKNVIELIRKLNDHWQSVGSLLWTRVYKTIEFYLEIRVPRDDL